MLAGTGIWSRLSCALGHDLVAPDLPSEDDSAGLTEYADAVIAAVGNGKRLVMAGGQCGEQRAEGLAPPVAGRSVPGGGPGRHGV